MLVGIVDPTHGERIHSGTVGRLPRWLPVEDVMAEAFRADPTWSPWTYELIAAAMGEFQERGNMVSTTALTTKCPRGEVLKRKAEYIESLDNLYAAFRGTGTHKLLESAVRDGGVAEVRFYTTIDGVELSGTPDLVTADTVWDYKQTENPPMYDYPWAEHKLQLEINRFLINNAEKWDGDLPWNPRTQQFEHLAVVYLGPKGPKVLECKKKMSVTTPTGKSRNVRVPDVWSDEEVLAEIRPKLHTFVNALESYPDFPLGAEKVWGGEPSWECPGPPLCYYPSCLAKRYPHRLIWESQ